MQHESSHRLAVCIAAISGAALALQQRINGELGVRIHDALAAALVSLAVAFTVSASIVAFSPAGRRAVRTIARIPPWRLLGGVGGACLLSVGAVATPRIGVALLTVGVVAGQTTGGVLMDRIGFGPGRRHALTSPRVGGVLLCLVAAGIGIIGHTSHHAGLTLVPFAIGAGLLASGQQALNGRVRQDTNNAMLAANVNFAVGMLALTLVLAVTAAASGFPDLRLPVGSTWFLLLGGPIGVLVVWVASFTVRSLGVLRLSLAVTAGQVVGSILIDVVAPAPGTTVSIGTVIGAVLAVFAVLVAGLGTTGGDRELNRAAHDRGGDTPASGAGIE